MVRGICNVERTLGRTFLTMQWHYSENARRLNFLHSFVCYVCYLGRFVIHDHFYTL